jgi:hypothetical protein
MQNNVDIRVGNLVSLGDAVYRISHVAVIGIHVESGLNTPLPVDELRPVPHTAAGRKREGEGSDENAFDKHAWKTAEDRFAVIDPLLLTPSNKTAVTRRAKETGISVPTVYRWIRLYRKGGLQALVPQKRGWSANKRRIDPRVVDIISKSVRDNRHAPVFRKIAGDTARICCNQGLRVPGLTTIRREISKILKAEKAG